MTPREHALEQAIRLVLAIADHPEMNPSDAIRLAPKTRAQLESALDCPPDAGWLCENHLFDRTLDD